MVEVSGHLAIKANKKNSSKNEKLLNNTNELKVSLNNEQYALLSNFLINWCQKYKEHTHIDHMTEEMMAQFVNNTLVDLIVGGMLYFDSGSTGKNVLTRSLSSRSRDTN